MIRCYITNSQTLATETLLDSIAGNLETGVTWLQIREKDLSTRKLFELVECARSLPNPHQAKIIVNSRVDVALAAGADGAHLPSDAPAPRKWRSILPAGFLIGVSCHSIEDLEIAEAEGADYALFGPVFPPLSKITDAEPQGLEGLRRAAGAVRIPVLALGGVTRESIPACISAGAAGIAGISLFQNF